LSVWGGWGGGGLSPPPPPPHLLTMCALYVLQTLPAGYTSACVRGAQSSEVVEVASKLSLVCCTSSCASAAEFPSPSPTPSSTSSALQIQPPQHSPRARLKNSERAHAMLFLGSIESSYAARSSAASPCATSSAKANPGTGADAQIASERTPAVATTTFVYLYALPTLDWLSITCPLYHHSQAELSGPLLPEDAVVIAPRAVLAPMEIYRFWLVFVLMLPLTQQRNHHFAVASFSFSCLSSLSHLCQRPQLPPRRYCALTTETPSCRLIVLLGASLFWLFAYGGAFSVCVAVCHTLSACLTHSCFSVSLSSPLSLFVHVSLLPLHHIQ
jgi:hypothetical protein